MAVADDLRAAVSRLSGLVDRLVEKVTADAAAPAPVADPDESEIEQLVADANAAADKAEAVLAPVADATPEATATTTTDAVAAPADLGEVQQPQ